MTKIQTKIFNYGNEKESSWPSQFGTGEKGVFHIDENGKSVPGYPPPKFVKLGEAPMFISDEMEPYRHPAALKTVTSKSELRKLDKACGTITTDRMQPADPSWAKENERKLRRDRRESLHKAVAQLEAGTAPLTEETRALCEARNEQVSQALGFDAFNVVGRRTNAKGKRFKHRRDK